MAELKYNTDQSKAALLRHIYFKQKMASGRDSIFYYISKTLGIETVSRRFIANWLAKQESQQLYSQPKPKTSIRPIISSKPGFLSVDLIDFSNQKFQGYCYILDCMDIFSRKCLAFIPLKNKKSRTTETNMKVVVEKAEENYKINVLKSDDGLDFSGLSKAFPNIKVLKSLPYTPQQNNVERSNKTLKSVLTKVLHNEKSKNWPKYLPEIQQAYNQGYNRIIKMSPDAAWESTEDEQKEIHSKNVAEKAKSYKEVTTTLNVRDNVRLIIPEALRKKGKPNYSDTIYKISRRTNGNGIATIPRYSLEGLKGNFATSQLLYIPSVEQSPQIPKVQLIRPKTTRTGKVY